MYNDDERWDLLDKVDKDVFLSLYKKYYHDLLFIGLKEVRDFSIVKDRIQELFLYLWKNRTTMVSSVNIRSYLVTSLLWKFKTDGEQSGTKTNIEWPVDEHSEDPLLTPGEELISNSQQGISGKLLVDRINALPAHQKKLIRMRFYEGLSYQEIIEKTGLPHSTVYDKIQEGLKKLKLNMVLIIFILSSNIA